MVICLGRGADLHVAHLMPLPLTVSCSRKSRLVYLSDTSSPGKSRTKSSRKMVVVHRILRKLKHTRYAHSTLCLKKKTTLMLHTGVLYTFLHPTPDPVVDRVQIRTVRRPQIWGDELWCLLLQQLNCLASMVHRCAVLLKHVRVTCNATHDWQHLLLQQNLVVVSASTFTVSL